MPVELIPKTNNKPDFGDSDGDSNNDSTSTQNSNAERISFAKGKSSATVSGSILKGNEKTYLIGARAGQTIKIEITEGGRTDDGGNNDTVSTSSRRTALSRWEWRARWRNSTRIGAANSKNRRLQNRRRHD